MGTKVFKVNVERDGKFWVVHVPEVKRSTQARNLGEIDPMARDLIGIMLDLDPQSFELDVVVMVPPAALAQLEESQRLRAVATDANAAAATALRAGVRGMVDAGFTTRDVGKLLGISFQRVHQLAHDEQAAPAPKRQPIKDGRYYGGELVHGGTERMLLKAAAGEPTSRSSYTKGA